MESERQDNVEAPPETGGPPGTPTAPLRVPAQAEIRAELKSLVLADLLGPRGGRDEEVDADRVSDRYLVGMLAGRRSAVEPGALEGVAVKGDEGAEDGADEAETPQVETMFPSSIGFTFSVLRSVEALRLKVQWGRYERRDSETLVTEKTGAPRKVWKRIPFEAVLDPLKLGEAGFEPWSPDPERPEVTVRGLVRPAGAHWIVTLFLVNGQLESKRLRDESWLFQPELAVETTDGSAAFVRRPRPARDPRRMDASTLAEEQSLEMLYRHEVEFAVGHGVAVHAETPASDPTRAVRLATQVVPAYELPATTSATAADHSGLAPLELRMKSLGDLPREELPSKLAPLADAYEAWIADRKERVEAGAEGLAEHRDAGLEELARCEGALRRIRDGIALVGTDDRAAAAFRFANKAMWLQRVHTRLAEAVRRGKSADLASVEKEEPATWHPFQLAFVLLNLPAITDLNHPHRSDPAQAMADLLWFPTGGGKTEAYLGLAAYTMAMRRLQGVVEGREGEHGVAVLMRYTLRLLTIQQFQRAAALVCACEQLRREALKAGNGRWGQEPFRIGLWVGMRTTPNTTENSHEAISGAHGYWRGSSPAGGSGTPAQLTNCPWCGARIDPGRHIKVERYQRGRARTLIYCSDPLGRCPFSEAGAPGEGLPVVVVDEEIYRRLPTLLIATVDKFAQLPWKGETQVLFGMVNAECPRHGFRAPAIEDTDAHQRSGNLPPVRSVLHPPVRPPDLIIQDELHLISGPLGTLVGLYETAVDHLCSWEVAGRRVRPKLVASTATVRRAGQQIHDLFARRVDVFPPAGTEARDSFFALRREPTADIPGRRYLGICAPGKRVKAAYIRVYVAHLLAAQTLYERYGRLVDPWMTLVGYFNTLRELGGMRRVVEDDVRSRLARGQELGFSKRQRPFVQELTSRTSSTDIPTVLDRLEVPFDPVDEEERRRAREENRHGPESPIDVLLATSMVSVGVDVQRLGLMVVAGQPKTTAEYIQATSRVGRRHPGLICTVFNWARPRDMSHYERFEHYHATFYQHVEALSVTPFAPRALDRGLSALLVALARLPGFDLNPNAAAEGMTPGDALIQKATETILARAERITGSNAVVDEVRRQLRSRVDYWHALARRAPATGSRLGYEESRDGKTAGLMNHASTGAWDPFTCLDSLRDVEPTVGLVLSDHGLDDEVVAPVAPTGTDEAAS